MHRGALVWLLAAVLAFWLICSFSSSVGLSLHSVSPGLSPLVLGPCLSSQSWLRTLSLRLRPPLRALPLPMAQ